MSKKSQAIDIILKSKNIFMIADQITTEEASI